MNLGGVIIPDIGLPSGYTFVGVLDEIYPMIRFKKHTVCGKTVSRSAMGNMVCRQCMMVLSSRDTVEDYFIYVVASDGMVSYGIYVKKQDISAEIGAGHSNEEAYQYLQRVVCFDFKRHGYYYISNGFN